METKPLSVLVVDENVARAAIIEAGVREAGHANVTVIHDVTGLARRIAVIAPSTSPAWPTDHVNGDHFSGAGYGIAAVAGTPSITVPAGEVRGLPVGVVFMGRAYSEAELLAYAYAFEQATRARKAPAFIPTLPY